MAKKAKYAINIFLTKDELLILAGLSGRYSIVDYLRRVVLKHIRDKTKDN